MSPRSSKPWPPHSVPVSSVVVTAASSRTLRDIHVFNIEGPGFLVDNFQERWADPIRRDALVEAARLIEEDRDMLGCASHLLVVAMK